MAAVSMSKQEFGRLEVLLGVQSGRFARLLDGAWPGHHVAAFHKTTSAASYRAGRARNKHRI
jgi:hypothetical protein